MYLNPFLLLKTMVSSALLKHQGQQHRLDKHCFKL